MKNWRCGVILILNIILSALLIGRLFFLQLVKCQYWKALAQGQQRFFEFFQEERGEIFFRGQEQLAVNQKFTLVYASPSEIKNPEETAGALSLVLMADKNLILEKLKKNTSYEVIKNKLSPEEVSELKKLNLRGIYFGSEFGRYYPFEGMASKVVGFLGGNGFGQYGIEGFYDDILRGKNKVLEKIMGPGGYFGIDILEQNGKGADIVLTIDYNIQFMAEKLLKEAKEKLDFEEGEIIVIEPSSGKILALANFPNFNPNEYQRFSNLEIFQNSTIQKVFEPGSVFKPITMAIALDQGKITPQTSYYDEGFVKIGGRTIFNYDKRVWGKRTMTEVLEKSINTGAIFVEKQVGHDIFLDYLNRFGIFEPTGVDLQGEIFSSNKEFKQGYEVNFATASFGQGIEMTSLQLVRAICAIANGGNLIKPYVVDKILKNGKIVENKTKFQKRLVISKEAASQLTTMLISVVENGFGKSAKIPGYYIAGKTGTAQVPWSALGVSKKGYSDKTWQSFIGYVPALDPKFLIFVKLYNSKTRDASVSAAPIFRELTKYILDLWQIPPDYE